MDRLLDRLPNPELAELNSISAEIMTNTISESGWTMYFDDSVDRWSNKNAIQFDIEKQQIKRSKYKHDAAERYRAFYHQASSITANEESTSMASDASSGPQKLPLPVMDIEFGQGQQASKSFWLVSRGSRDVQDKQEDLESIASCSTAGVNIRGNKFGKVDENEQALMLQDTASSDVYRPESGIIESESNIEQNLHLQARSLDDIEGVVKKRFRSSAILLPDGVI